MKLVFADEAWEDYLYWQKQDKRIVERINKLIREVQREPFSGVGKPEPLKTRTGRLLVTPQHRRTPHGLPG
jgi:toxin YoeB